MDKLFLLVHKLFVVVEKSQGIESFIFDIQKNVCSIQNWLLTLYLAVRQFQLCFEIVLEEGKGIRICHTIKSRNKHSFTLLWQVLCSPLFPILYDGLLLHCWYNNRITIGISSRSCFNVLVGFFLFLSFSECGLWLTRSGQRRERTRNLSLCLSHLFFVRRHPEMETTNRFFFHNTFFLTSCCGACVGVHSSYNTTTPQQGAVRFSGFFSQKRTHQCSIDGWRNSIISRVQAMATDASSGASSCWNPNCNRL